VPLLQCMQLILREAQELEETAQQWGDMCERPRTRLQLRQQRQQHAEQQQHSIQHHNDNQLDASSDCELEGQLSRTASSCSVVTIATTSSMGSTGIQTRSATRMRATGEQQAAHEPPPPATPSQQPASTQATAAAAAAQARSKYSTLNQDTPKKAYK
jgi:hypothetical protein